jgi:hypothetical protein
MYGDTYDFTKSTHAAASLTPQGVENLLLTTGTFPSTAFDVTHYGMHLKAFVKDTTAAMVSPTMDELVELLDKQAEAGFPPSTVAIAEQGIWTAYAVVDRDANAMVQVPMGGSYTAAGGVAGPMLSHMGMRFQRFASSRIRPNSILMLDPESFIKFSPTGPDAIHWVNDNGIIAGAGSIFTPRFDGPQQLEIAAADFNFWMEFGCRYPARNIRRLGIKAMRDL